MKAKNMKSAVKSQRQSASIAKSKAVQSMKKNIGPKMSFKYADIEEGRGMGRPMRRRRRRSCPRRQA